MAEKKRSRGVPATPNATFSLRLPPADYAVLVSLANLKNVSIAVLARDYIFAGMTRDLDPKEIEHQINLERDRLLKAAAEMRQMRDNGTEAYELRNEQDPPEEPELREESEEDSEAGAPG